jgi:hypothetical protein
MIVEVSPLVTAGRAILRGGVRVRESAVTVFRKFEM